MKPNCKLIGEDGNIFNLLGLTRRSLINAGECDKCVEMTGRILQAGSYDEALQIIMDHVMLNKYKEQR